MSLFSVRLFFFWLGLVFQLFKNVNIFFSSQAMAGFCPWAIACQLACQLVLKCDVIFTKPYHQGI